MFSTNGIYLFFSLLSMVCKAFSIVSLSCLVCGHSAFGRVRSAISRIRGTVSWTGGTIRRIRGAISRIRGTIRWIRGTVITCKLEKIWHFSSFIRAITSSSTQNKSFFNVLEMSKTFFSNFVFFFQDLKLFKHLNTCFRSSVSNSSQKGNSEEFHFLVNNYRKIKMISK